VRILRSLISRVRKLDAIELRCERMQEALGRIEARQLATLRLADLHAAEFRVFSQWGEDGIIQRLVSDVPIERRLFVEFGVQDYSESNTRFLLVNRNWSGLVLDGDQSNIDAVRRSDLYWRHNLKAECAFVTRENINQLIAAAGVQGDVGLLSVDIDGNDYWVWEAIDVISPRIVVAEYNSRFGAARAVTVPYDPAFERSRAHHSMIYYGASLRALELLGARKGYSLVGCNSAGNNAFFVRLDCLPTGIPRLTAAQAFVAGAFREARNERGEMQFLSAAEESRLLDGLPLTDVSA
jgi:hypothetical protein